MRRLTCRVGAQSWNTTRAARPSRISWARWWRRAIRPRRPEGSAAQLRRVAQRRDEFDEVLDRDLVVLDLDLGAGFLTVGDHAQHAALPAERILDARLVVRGVHPFDPELECRHQMCRTMWSNRARRRGTR